MQSLVTESSGGRTRGWVPDCQSVRQAQSQVRAQSRTRWRSGDLLGRKCHREWEIGVLGKAGVCFLVMNAGALFRRGDEVVITQWTDKTGGRMYGRAGVSGGSRKSPVGLSDTGSCKQPWKADPAHGLRLGAKSLLGVGGPGEGPAARDCSTTKESSSAPESRTQLRLVEVGMWPARDSGALMRGPVRDDE